MVFVKQHKQLAVLAALLYQTFVSTVNAALKSVPAPPVLLHASRTSK